MVFKMSWVVRVKELILQMLQGPLIALSFLFIFESFNAQKFGIKGVGKGPVTTIKRL